MKKTITIIILILVSNLVFGQKYYTKNGQISFEASVPLFEDIFAIDKANTCILNTENGEIASVSNVKNFKFKVSLMEEHFNENYAETSKYPKTTFKGKILNFEVSKLKNTPTKYILKGKLNFHGKENTIETPIMVSLQNNTIYINGKFVAKTADYGVTIPKMVSKKIAENVNVSVNLELKKQ